MKGLLICVCVTVLTSVGCGNQDTPDGPPQCVPGAVATCPCTNGGSGTQACGTEGTFGPCECPDDVVLGDSETGDVIEDIQASDTEIPSDAVPPSDTGMGMDTAAEEDIIIPSDAPPAIDTVGDKDVTTEDDATGPSCEDATGVITLTESVFSGAVQLGGETMSWSLMLNSDTDSGCFTATSDQEWLIAPNGSQALPGAFEVSVDTTKLPWGSQQATLTLTSESDGESVTATFSVRKFSAWESAQGPGRGTINTLIAHPTVADTFFIGTYGGVYRSTDGAKTWNPVSQGIDPAHHIVRALAYDEAKGHLFAGTLGGVYRSTNDGASWTYANQGIPDTTQYGGIRVLHIGDSGRLFAGSGAVYSTDDGGENWITLGCECFTNALIETDNSILVGTVANGVFRSTDDGITFDKIFPKAGNGPPPSPIGVASFLWDKESGVIRAAQTDLFSSKTKFLESQDDGLTWTSITQELNWKAAHVVTDPTDFNTLYAAADTTPIGGGGEALLKSTNGGKLWKDTSLTGQKLVQAVAVDPVEPKTVVAAGDGVWVSAGGAEFIPSNEGVVATSVVGIAPTTTQGPLYVTTATQCLFKGDNAYADTWVSLEKDLPCELTTGDVAVHPTEPNTVWVVGSTKLYRSTDGGVSFPHISMEGQAPFRLLTNHLSPSTVYVGCSNNGVFKTTNAGDSWSDITGNLPFSVQDLSLGGSSMETLWAGVNSEQNVYRSIDAGVSWQPVGKTLPSIGRRLAVSPTDGDHAVVFTSQAGMYVTFDGGANWTDSPFPSVEVKDIVFVGEQNDTVIAGSDQGAFVSLNGGMTWNEVTSGLSNTSFRRMVTSENSSVIYGGTLGAGLYRMTW